MGQPTPPASINAYAQQQALLAANSPASSSSGGQLSLSSRIYMSHGTPGIPGAAGNIASQFGPYAPGAPKSAHPSNAVSYQDARLAPLSWSDQQIKTFVNQGILNKNPNFGPNMGMPEILSAWDEAVKASFAWNQSSDPNAQKWTPQDVLDSYKAQAGKFGTVRQGDWMVDAQTGERVKYVGATSKTTKTTTINLSSAQDVQALTTQVLTQALGRAPTAKEVAQYKSTLNAAEKANPQTTTTVSQLTPNAATGSVDIGNQSSTTTGGLSSAAEQQMVMNTAQDSPEFAKYQAGTTYFNALMQMIGGGG